MSVLHDLRCDPCRRTERDVECQRGSIPPCPRCGGARRWLPFAPHTDLWGGPKRIRSLDRTFASSSDMKAYLKRNHLESAGDRVGGMRNSGQQFGRIYSGGGITRRSSYAKGYGTSGVE